MSPSYVLPDWEWQLLTSAGTYLGPLGSATSRSVSWPLDGPATAQCTLVATHPDAGPVLELATDLLVSRAGRALFRGRITASTETHSGVDDTLALTATDYRGLLDHRLIWPGTGVDFTAVPLDAAEICWTLIQTMQLLEGGTGAGDYDLGIRMGAGYPSYNTNRLFTVGNTVGSAITELGNASAPDGTAGFDWDVDVNLLFNVYHPHRGADNGVDLVYGSNLVAVTIGISPDGYANAIYMTGGKPTHPISFNALVPAGYGAWDQQKSDPNQVLQLALDDAAAGWGEQLSQVGYQTVQAVLPAGVWDPATMWRGDTVHLTIDVGRLSASGLARTIEQVDVALDDNGVEVVTLNLGQPAPKLTRRFGSITRRISKLELEPKGHVFDSHQDVTGPVASWFVISSYTPPNDAGYASQQYRAQVRFEVAAGGAVVQARVRFTDSSGAETMTLYPTQAVVAGKWFPPSVHFGDVPGSAITVEGWSDKATTKFSGQIESV